MEARAPWVPTSDLHFPADCLAVKDGIFPTSAAPRGTNYMRKRQPGPVRRVCLHFAVHLLPSIEPVPFLHPLDPTCNTISPLRTGSNPVYLLGMHIEQY